MPWLSSTSGPGGPSDPTAPSRASSITTDTKSTTASHLAASNRLPPPLPTKSKRCSLPRYSSRIGSHFRLRTTGGSDGKFLGLREQQGQAGKELRQEQERAHN